MPDYGISGLASNFDWRAFIDQVLDLERAPQRRLASEQNLIEQRKNAYSAVTTQLSVLQNRVEELQDTDLFDARAVTSSDETVARASVSAGATTGSYEIDISQLATASRQLGASNVGGGLSATADVSGVTLGSAALGATFTAGTFTVNGKTITVAGTDTLQSVFDQISTATSGDVTGSYDPATDRVSLSGGSTIVLGSTVDTSNFLQAFKLHNNGTGVVSSSASLGTLRLNEELADANFVTAVDDGGSGAGQFKINGVAISFSETDTVQDILSRINNSAAGVSASYDSVNDRLVLTNESTGDLGISMEDVTGNFLAASGLSGGALQRGDNLLYTVNGGGQLISYSNTISAENSGITGLTVTALAEDTVTVQVSSDTAKMKDAISDFIEDYNRVQSLLDTYTASSTDADGTVAAGTLAGDSTANDLARRLRSAVNATFSDLSGTLKRLEALGISSNGTDNSLAIEDSEALDDALANHLDDVKDIFTNETSGLGKSLADLLEATIGDDGSLSSHQDTLDEQIAEIDDQITEQERIVQFSRERMITSFVAMEQAQQRINQQLQYLQQRFGTS